MPFLYERLRAHLLDQIRSGRLKPGDRVPSESMLAAQFNVSRITSKKALETLERDGLIVRFRGKGSFVAQRAESSGSTSSGAATTSSISGHANDTFSLPAIGLVAPHWSDTYGSSMLMAIEERCAELDHALVVKRSKGCRECEEQAIFSLVQLGVRGLIVFPVHGEIYNDALLRIVLDGFPVVLVDRYLKGIAVKSVGTDNYAACHELTSELLESGHRNIAFASLPSERTSSIDDRRRGFGAALRDHGLTYGRANHIAFESPLPVVLTEAHIERDRLATHQFLDANPDVTAFVACEFAIAVILEHALRDRGRDDLIENIVCFDAVNNPLDPVRFTHILQDEHGMGVKAVDLLTGQSEVLGTPPRINIPHQLVRRAQSIFPLQGGLGTSRADS